MKKSDKKGNVLFIILIAVGLFAALAYTVSNSFRGGTDTISKEQARVATGSFLRELNTVKEGYNYLWANRGCSMDEISYKAEGKSISSNNFDARLPRGNNDCDVFHPQGAGINYPSNITNIQDNPGGIGELAGRIHFVINTQHYMYIFNINREVCLLFNRLMGHTEMVNGEPSVHMYAFENFEDITPYCEKPTSNPTYQIMFPIYMGQGPTAI